MRTTDPAELARLAREDKDGLVRAKAVQLLAKDWTSRSQQLFAEVAQDDQDGSVRWEAVKGLYDVDILAKIAKKGDADRRVIQCAVGGLFANVTHCYLPLPREGSVRTAAGYETKKVAWVSSLNILADVAKNGQCCEASRDALERLKECADSMDSSGTNFRAILADIAQTASDKAIRSRAVYLMDSVK